MRTNGRGAGPNRVGRYADGLMPAPVTPSPVSVVVPAHNEESVISRCLASLLDGSAPGEVEVVVVCNGCQDATAEAARRAAPGALVLETPVASKVAALNLGDQHAHHFPRFYVDADVELPIGDLRTVATLLRQGDVHCAAPTPRFELADRPWAVKAFYQVWLSTPYHREQMIGSGVYALSGQGRSRFDDFPALTADDQFVQQLFGVSERRALPGASFTVHPPRNLRGLVNMRARAYRGNRELAGSGLAGTPPPPSGLRTALAMARDPFKAPAVGVYVSVNLAAKALARRRGQRWERDDSARRLVTPSAPVARG